MSKNLFNSISKKYEFFFKKLMNKGLSSIETVKVLNDVILLPYILEKSNQITLSEEVFQEINSVYLFSTNDIYEKCGNVLNDMIFFFYHNITSSLVSSSEMENLLGSVLEKHINRKKTGSYYTPNDTTKYIGWNSILISILNKLNKYEKKEVLDLFKIESCIDLVNLKMDSEQIIYELKKLSDNTKICLLNACKKVKIIDPTCGSGAFIVTSLEFFKFLNEKLLDGALSQQDIFKTLYGLDISEEAVLLTKMRCIINMHSCQDFEKWFFKIFDSHFIVSDALTGKDCKINSGYGFDWNALGKFDCIIGNPPYVEHKSEVTNRFVTKKCGNLYAYVTERACNILKENGIISFIVPLSFLATPRMKDVRGYLHSHSKKVYYSSYSDRPGCLFTGVHQRLIIFFAECGKNKDGCHIYTTKFNYWYNGERDYLFKNMEYIENNYVNLPKIGNNIECDIIDKISECNRTLLSYFSNSYGFEIWISTRIGFWTKAFMNKIETDELKKYNVESEIIQKVLYCLLNSSLFYYYWIINSDCWHVTNKDLDSFKFDMNILTDKDIFSLLVLSSELEEDLEKNKLKIDTKQTMYEYKHKYSKEIIDRIDDIFCTAYNFTNAEKEFVKSYAIKYRMNTYHKENKK